MKKLSQLLIVLAFTYQPFLSNAGTFTSRNDISTDWNLSTSWNAIGDADGIPDIDDVVQIQAGHTITIPSNTTHHCLDLEILGTLNLNSQGGLYIEGNYVNNGTESGSGFISFIGSDPNSFIAGSGAFSADVRYSFSRNRIIQSGTTIVKNYATNTVIGPNITVRNFGNYTLGRLGSYTGSQWINENGGVLTIIRWAFSTSPLTLNASAPGNTVVFSFNDANYAIKIPLGNTFHHLSITGTATKGIPTSLNVNGNLNCSAPINLNGNNLNIGGNYTYSIYNQNFNSPSSSITFIGTSTQTISGPSNRTTRIGSLHISNPSGVNVVSGNILVENSLTVNSGNFNCGSLNTTLLSNATTTAYIAPSNGTISGSMIMQRHISSRVAGFSTMSSPSTGSTVQDWDNELLIVYATGGSSFPSVVGYSETLLDWEYVSSATEPLTPGKGFEVWLDDNGTYTSFTAATIDIRGTPNRGNISRSVTVDNDGWNLIGNPYAAHISFSDFRANAGVPMSDYFMYWDEAEDDYSFGGPGDEIAPHQGFWIEASSAGNVIFRETNKTTSNSSFFRSTQNGFFRLKLKHEGNISFTSNTNFLFEDGLSNAYEQGSDVTFKKVPHPNAPSLYSLSIDGKRLRLNKMEAENNLDLPLGFAVGVSGFYTISANELGLAQDAGFNCVVLEDKLTKTFTDLTEGNYRFYADGTSDERFILHLSKDNSACNRNLVTSASSELQGISITHTEQGIFVNYDLEDEMNSVISVSNLLGQEIVSARSISISKGNIRVALPESFHGMFIVSVRQGEKMVTRKFFAP